MEGGCQSLTEVLTVSATRADPGPLLHTVPEAARLLSVSVRTVWRLIDDGTLPVAHVRGAARVSDEALRDFAGRASRWHRRPVRRQVG
jgi:excisionase family DNA binding protein